MVQSVREESDISVFVLFKVFSDSLFNVPPSHELLSNGCPENSSLCPIKRENSPAGGSGYQLSMLQHSLMPSASGRSMKGAGPQTRTVPSSEALARSPGTTGFQLTQFTVRV